MPYAKGKRKGTKSGVVQENALVDASVKNASKWDLN